MSHPKHQDNRGNQGRPAPPPADARGERLQKVLAAAGVGSRRECEQLVLEGRVDVDGQVVTQLGTRVDPTRQQIRVDATPLARPRLQYFALNKPPGVITTARDPWARPRVTDLVPEEAGRVFAVGRLDMSSEGLVLLTNDGELANQLAHPRYEVEKTYLVQVAGKLEPPVLEKLRSGIWVSEGRVRPERVFIHRRHKQSTLLHIILSEGRNREIRRMLAALGHKVQRLRRIAIGPLKLGDLPLGQCRPLARDEIRALKAAAARPIHGRRPQRNETAAAEAPARRIRPAVRPAVRPAAPAKPNVRRPRKFQPSEGRRRGQAAGKPAPSGRPAHRRDRARRDRPR